MAKMGSGKFYTGEGPPSFEKMEKPVWRPKGRQLNKFRSILFTLKLFSSYLILPLV